LNKYGEEMCLLDATYKVCIYNVAHSWITCQKVFSTWINFLYTQLRALFEMKASWENIERYIHAKNFHTSRMQVCTKKALGQEKSSTWLHKRPKGKQLL
jgi:hypothetical protein